LDDICKKAAQLKVNNFIQQLGEGEFLSEYATLDEAIQCMEADEDPDQIGADMGTCRTARILSNSPLNMALLLADDRRPRRMIAGSRLLSKQYWGPALAHAFMIR